MNVRTVPGRAYGGARQMAEQRPTGRPEGNLPVERREWIRRMRGTMTDRAMAAHLKEKA